MLDKMALRMGMGAVEVFVKSLFQVFNIERWNPLKEHGIAFRFLQQLIFRDDAVDRA